MTIAVSVAELIVVRIVALPVVDPRNILLSLASSLALFGVELALEVPSRLT